MKRLFVGDPDEATLHIHYEAPGRQSSLSQYDSNTQKVLKRLFISDTGEAPGRQCSLSQYSRLLRRWFQNDNSLVTLGKAVLCTSTIQISKETAFRVGVLALQGLFLGSFHFGMVWCS